MGVYGNIHGAFSGLGKPSIKLEFEDNEALVAFSKKMQEDEPAPVEWNEKEGMFTPVEGVALTEDDFFDVLEQNTEPYIYKDFNEKNVISVFGKPKHREDSYGNVKYAFEIKTPLKGSESKVYIWADMNHALFDNSTKENRSAFWTMIKPTIERPAIVFYKDGKNHFVKCFTMPDGKKVVFSFIPSLVIEKNIKTFLIRDERKKGQIYKKYKDGGSVRFLDSNPTFNGIERHDEPVLFVECRLYCDKVSNNISDRQTFSEKSLDGYGDFYTVRDMRKRSRKEPGDVATNKNLQFTKDNDRKINNFDRSLYELTNGVNSWNYGEKLKDTHWRTLTVKYNPDNGKHFTVIQLFFPYTLRRDLDKPTFTGYAGDVDVDVDLNNLYNYSYYIDSRNYVDRQKLEGFVKDDYYKTLLIEAIKSGYKQLQQRLINAKNSRLTNTPSNIAEAERLIKYYKMLYSDPSKYDLLDKAYGGGFKNISNKLKKFLGEGGLALDSLGAPGDTYIITDTRTRARKDLENTAALKKYDIRKFSGEELRRMQTDDPLLYEQIKSDINTPATAQQTLPISTLPISDSPLTRQYNAIKQKYPDAVLLFNVRSYYEAFGDDAKKIADVLGISLTQRTGQYLAGFKVRDLKKNLKKLIKAGVKVAVCEQTEQALGAVNYYVKAYYPGLGKTANNALYNNLDILDYRGMQPTYRQLPNYDAFFKPAANKNSLKGFGLADTKKLIADICRNHYKECAAIARHLKAETKLQSAFNLWHWLHHNIRYEYDREGREEVRTPARVWADRHRGVDCDCLSVFAWCVLKCMGYDPAFELAAFRNKPAYSHIYINLDGIVVDRVWYVFNSRPPFITKTELFKVGMLDNLGQLF